MLLIPLGFLLDVIYVDDSNSVRVSPFTLPMLGTVGLFGCWFDPQSVGSIIALWECFSQCFRQLLFAG